jgi:hypothetical protein
MSLAVSISISDNATPFVTALERDVQPSREMYQAVAEQMLPEVQRSFQSMSEREQNALKHTGFWMRMIDGTHARWTDDAAIVSMPREVAQRYFGGTITPKNGNWLTLPMRTEAVGVSARQFDDLRFVPIGNDEALLVQRDAQTLKHKKRRDGSRPATPGGMVGGLAFYLLVKSVTQSGNSDVLPDEEEFASAAKRGINYFLNLRYPG